MRKLLLRIRGSGLLAACIGWLAAAAAQADVVYYVGHQGMAFDEPPCDLMSAWMYCLEASTEELHNPDLLFDISDVMASKLGSLRDTRPIFGVEGQAQVVEEAEIIARFWGLRCGVKYAEPLYQTWGSMRMAQLTRDHYRISELPLERPGQGA